MTSGTIKFYVDGVECPDTSGVGVNAIGGVFNCGLTGLEFKVRCTDTCMPSFSVRELKIWKAKVLNVFAENNFYTLPGNDANAELPKVFLTGTYSTNDFMTAFSLNKGTAIRPGVCMGLPKQAHVNMVVTSVFSNHHG